MKADCIEVFNAMIRGTPVDFNQKLLPIILNFLTENNYENPEKIISLLQQEHHLIELLIPKITKYFCIKYNLYYITFNNKLILYYG